MSGSFVPLMPRRVLVIGGGPCGLVALRNLVKRGRFDHVEVYERRNDVGGVWYFEDSEEDTTSSEPTQGSQAKYRSWPSPAYKGLIGNVLPEFLSFSEYPIPLPPLSPRQPFPSLTETYNYLRSFAEPYIQSGSIKLNREVICVEELLDGKGWRVVSRDWTAGGKGQQVDETWDAVVVAVGWYDNPVWPETEGLDGLKQKGMARHAKSWRGAKGYEGTRNLVVGNANSSNDIASHLAPVAETPVYQSIRRPAFPGFPSLPDERILMVAPVSKYVHKSTSSGDKFDALLSDGSVLADLDFAHIGTGYRPFPNFVYVLDRSTEGSKELVPLVTDETKPNRVPSLHRLILYAHNISLGFVGAPMVYTPFIIADVVSTWLALAWRGEVMYPDTPNGRLAWEKQRLQTVEEWRTSMDNPSSFMVFSVMGSHEQEYASTLKEDIVKARPAMETILPVWNDQRTEVRESMFKLKLEALRHAKDHQGL